jgi:para-aminobenzoate synthetase component 1
MPQPPANAAPSSVNPALRGPAASLALPLVEELPPDTDIWPSVCHLATLPRLLLLDSALPHITLGRYAYLTADPCDWLWARGARVWSSRAGRSVRTDPFQVVAERLAPFRSDPVPDLPPFQGGAAGLFGYGLCHHLERIPRPRLDEFQVPELAVGIYDWVVAFDRGAGRSWLISTGYPETDPRKRRRRAARRLREVKDRLAGAEPSVTDCPTSEGSALRLADQWPVPGWDGVYSSLSRDGYQQVVERALEYIAAGDCFQVNLAQRLVRRATLPPLELYRRLREQNPAPFAGYLDLGDFAIASASPERFLRVEGGVVGTRPIKGTRPRGATPAEDRSRAEELHASPKDRAENVMIVDVLRNDLGRVCRYGSVSVPAVCRVETYPFVHHLVSEIRGCLRDGLGPVDVLRASFPGGSVTGAPKIRAMEIISELEPAARGPYCGALGYIGFGGQMDTSILIRTLTVGRGWVQFPVGGGIVADSVPQREYEETWHKAAGLLRALGD